MLILHCVHSHNTLRQLSSSRHQVVCTVLRLLQTRQPVTITLTAQAHDVAKTTLSSD